MKNADYTGSDQGVPTPVSTAQVVDFGVPITGFLCCAQFLAPFLVGMVFGDKRGRFADGNNIRTSAIARVFLHKGYLLCETYSGSRYVVCHWLHESGSLPGIDVLH